MPAVKEAYAEAKEQAGPIAEEAKRRSTDAAAALKGETVKKKGGKKKKFFLVAVVAGGGAVLFSKLRSKDESANWQSSYTPAPAPAAPPAPPSPAAPMGGSHAADVADDTAGANPGESIADAADKPHPVTTPDAPAEEVDVGGRGTGRGRRRRCHAQEEGLTRAGQAVGDSSALSRRTRALTCRSTQKIRIGTSPASSTSAVNPSGQRIRRESANDTTR